MTLTSDDAVLVIPIFLLLVVIWSIGVFVGGRVERIDWHKKLIERGVAQYNWMTGKWEWKDDGTPLKGPKGK